MRTPLAQARIVALCAQCHRKRNARGEWVPLSADELSLLQLIASHGICPDCLRELYPEMKGEKDHE